MSIRLGAKQRRKMILQAGAVIAKNEGLRMVNHENVAEACPIVTSKATVLRYFPTANDLWHGVYSVEPDDLREQAVALGLDVLI